MANEAEERMTKTSTQQEQQHRWEPPKPGMIKINTDAAISNQSVRTGKGIIPRNWTGKLMKAKGIMERKKGTAMEEEALAVRAALVMAKAAGWMKIEVQSDCKSVVNQINASSVHDISIATVLEDIEELKEEFEECNFSFVYRTGNTCSHTLAQNAIKLVHDIEWNKEFQVWLMDIARKDMRAVAPFCN
ncbi:uncharacterized protein LOC113758609 [Coffea eugenioides]|uniref:uncharacterized protein LOC113758609 n=1 Tax=Coffea eugenioides TaxID=49369 RepID=UPI000F61494A|nr:uncharacterized protein LOC113758609 [Coffea eugenioides]